MDPAKNRELQQRYRDRHRERIRARGRVYAKRRYWERTLEERRGRWAADRERRRAVVDQLIVERGGACERCGSVDDLCWHHRDPATKEFDLGRRKRGVAAAIAEAAKCDLLCGACHREVHNS